MEENVCANILKSGYWPRTRCCLKNFHTNGSGGHLVQWSGTLWPSWISDQNNFNLFLSEIFTLNLNLHVRPKIGQTYVISMFSGIFIKESIFLNFFTDFE